MRIVDLIDNKRQGGEHSAAELEHLIGGYLQGSVPDYQVAAWLMAVCWRAMSSRETADLTRIMAASGDMLDLSDLPHTVDKHSTGGVGDKTSLVLAPLLASCGATVAKMSGRGLGHTGGTIDKLEAVAGFKTTLSERDFIEQARDIGVVLAGQSLDLAPADGALYALRDATATVQSLPLIAASIMSKKLASGAESIVLDVKVGRGAFMKSVPEARELAATMIDIGTRAGRRVRAVLSRMDEPLGHAVGNALEVVEAMRCLQGRGPSDVEELCLTLAREVLAATGLASEGEALRRKLTGGAAFEKFLTWLQAQGGNVSTLEQLSPAPHGEMMLAREAGFIDRVDALDIGRAVALLGGGRRTKDAPVDLRVGVTVHVKVGDEVASGDPLATLHHARTGLAEAAMLVRGAIGTAPSAPDRPPLIIEVLG